MKMLARWGAWAILLALGAALTTGVVYGLNEVFFTRNDHFRLRTIDITIYGDRSFSEETIRQQLRQMGVVENNVNLFEIDLARIRKKLRAEQVSVNHVSVRRHLPGTLKVIMRQRDAVAQLLYEKGLLLDRAGMVIPDSSDPRTWTLPIITGLRSGSELHPGMKVEDPLGNAALDLILLMRSEPYASMMDINLVQIDYSAKALKIYVQEHPPFREGACVVLPAENKAMRQALKRLRAIAAERRKGKQPIRFVDATYKINVPVRP